jgi:hypothetical protein
MNTTAVTTFLDRYAVPVTESGCWLWSGSVNNHGYGVAFRNSGRIGAHRLAFAIAHGPITTGMLVCHRCDVRCCVNPQHLFLGTSKDNSADMTAKGRQARGENMKHSRFTPDVVRLIRMDSRSERTISAEYGVAKSVIWKIRNRQSWRHVA